MRKKEQKEREDGYHYQVRTMIQTNCLKEMAVASSNGISPLDGRD